MSCRLGKDLEGLTPAISGGQDTVQMMVRTMNQYKTEVSPFTEEIYLPSSGHPSTNCR